jgi:outer membrane lipoprotein
MKHRILLVAVLILSACAMQPPEVINRGPISALTVTQVRAAADGAFAGSVVRWGGVITDVENLSDRTLVEVVSHTLATDGRPESDGTSDGRFIARFNGFVEPLTYKTGALLTVVGDVGDEAIVRPIGDYEYSFPVVNVSGAYLWAADSDTRVMPPPWWYYDPWPYYPRYYPHRWPHYPYRGW